MAGRLPSKFWSSAWLRPTSDWLPGEGTGCVEVGSLVDPHSQPVNELAAQPAGHCGQADADYREDKRQDTRVGGIVQPQQEADQEEHNDDDVPASMPEAYGFGSGAARDVEPVQEPEQRS
jgi:hypothetical protein